MRRSLSHETRNFAPNRTQKPSAASLPICKLQLGLLELLSTSIEVLGRATSSFISSPSKKRTSSFTKHINGRDKRGGAPTTASINSIRDHVYELTAYITAPAEDTPGCQGVVCPHSSSTLAREYTSYVERDKILIQYTCQGPI
jgi:hypothetical protein